MHKTIILLSVSAILSFCVFGYAAGGGDIKFESPTLGAVLFSHDYHTQTKGIRCMACHFRMFEETGGSYHMKKEKVNKRDFCQYCHNGMKGFDAASSQNCSRCHKK